MNHIEGRAETASLIRDWQTTNVALEHPGAMAMPQCQARPFLQRSNSGSMILASTCNCVLQKTGDSAVGIYHADQGFLLNVFRYRATNANPANSVHARARTFAFDK